MKKIYLLILFALSGWGCPSAWAKAYPEENPKMYYQAMRTDEKPTIDGRLEENAWYKQPNFYKGHFTQNQPNNGQVSAQETEIYILYNDQALFIGVRLLDTQADSILTQFGPRDSQSQNADMFSVSIDTYNKQQNAFSFMVSAAGVQTDIFITGDNEDENWNAVWKSAVHIDEQGWYVEMEIPYSAIRFPKQDVQTWGINFMRQVRRIREISYWNPVDASIDGFVNQFGELQGLRDIEPPLRLSFTPYVSAYYTLDDVNQDQGGSFNGGMDIKYGINESFTLDLSLIPDFGQVRSDNVVLNLSPFEVRFSENRPFFTEGTELFNKGGLFYSRRIGATFGSPDLRENEEIVSGVSEAPLLNATKMSGRTGKGTGIGFFNALTNQTHATVENSETGERREAMVDPVTNFNVLVFDQNLKNNSNIGIINTNVTRFGSYDANVTGVDFRFNDKKNTYRLDGFAALSQIYDREGEDNILGYKYNWSFGKVSGKWQFTVEQNVESDDYQINDLGFLRSNNEIGHYAWVNYNLFQPKGIFLRRRHEVGIWYERLYNPSVYTGYGVWNYNWLRFKNFWESGIFIGIRPNEGYNYFEPRVQGRYHRWLPHHNFNVWIDTDRRKRLYFEVYAGMWERPVWSEVENWWGISPNFRVNDKFSIEHNLNFSKSRNERGFTRFIHNEQDEIEEIIYGARTVRNITNTFSLNFSFNAKMNLNLRVRHYWSNVQYKRFFYLDEEGILRQSDYQGLEEDGTPSHDRNFNAFNVDLVYVWQFAPGSEMSVVWKDAIIQDDAQTQVNFLQNFKRTVRAPQVNSVSIRILYFLDYLYLKKKNKN